MIAKRISCSTVRGVVQYNQAKEKNNESQLIASKYVLPGSAKEMASAFETLITGNRAIRNKYEHVILSFPTSFNLNDQNRIPIIETYLDGIGFANQPYVAYLHTDTPNHHIHIITTPIDIRTKRRIYVQLAHTKGRGVNLTKRVSERVVRRMRKEFNIVLGATPIENKNKSVKNRVLYALERTLKKYQVRSPAVLNALLSKHHGISLVSYSKEKKLTGVVYRFKEHPSLKGSIFHHTATHRALEKTFDRNSKRYNQQDSARYKSVLEVLIDTKYKKEAINAVFQHFGWEIMALDKKGHRNILVDHNNGAIHSLSSVTRKSLRGNQLSITPQQASDTAQQIITDNHTLLSPVVQHYDEQAKRDITTQYRHQYKQSYDPDTSRTTYVFQPTIHYFAMQRYISSGAYDDMEKKPFQRKKKRRPPLRRE